MKRLKDIPNLSPKAIELFQSSGYLDVASLKKHTLEEITEETAKTNEILDIFPESPTDELLAVWLAPLGFEPPEPLPTQSEIEISSKHIISPQSLLSASFAIPLSQNFIKDNSLNIENLPSGAIRYISEEEALKHMSPSELEEPAAVTEEPVQKPNKPVVGLEKTTRIELSAPLEDFEETEEKEEVKEIEKAAKEIQELPEPDTGEIFSDPVFSERSDNIINKSRIIDMETFRTTGSRVEPLQSASANDLTRATKKETNAGIDPSSRRYIKGVLHSRAGDFMISTLAFLLFLLCIIGAFAITPLLFVDKEKYWWAMFAPGLIFVGLFIYFAFTRRAMCPICNQKQFALKRCLKHRNAHHWGPLGYMLPTAIHIVLFKWFRCIFCGTSVRLKE